MAPLARHSRGMEERRLNEDDRTLLFVVLFDLRALLARLVGLVAGGDDDEEEGQEDPDAR